MIAATGLAVSAALALLDPNWDIKRWADVAPAMYSQYF
jgi:hypothetical protein